MNIDDEQLHGSQHLPLPFLRDWPSHSFQQVVTQFVAQCIDLLIFQKLRLRRTFTANRSAIASTCCLILSLSVLDLSCARRGFSIAGRAVKFARLFRYQSLNSVTVTSAGSPNRSASANRLLSRCEPREFRM